MKMKKTLSQAGEFGWIASLQKKLRPGRAGIKGIGDDTAVLPGTNKDILLTTDMLIEGHHFKRGDASPYEIGRKAMAVNLSDIAAMAGIPKYAVVAVGLPSNLKITYADALMRGLSDLARSFAVEIVGGDTNQSDKITIAVTLMGEVAKGKAVLRSGAKCGDYIFVTGALGGSYASKKHLRFMPQVELAQKLSKLVRLHSMMDISDGLISDLKHICEESRVGADLFAPQIPRSSRSLSLESALTDGEDFELLFTVSDKDARKILASPKFASRVYPVGRVTDVAGAIRLLDAQGKRMPLKLQGFDHFKNEKK